MQRTLTSILLIGLSIHLLLSVAVIVNIPFLTGTRISKLYKVYLIPGPFFKADNIINSYTLSLSWKRDGKWSMPMSPVNNNFNRYNEGFNPTELYCNRFERSLYQGLFLDTTGNASTRKNARELQPMIKYWTERYLPQDADSLRILITRKRAQHFKVQSDTVCTIAN